MDTGLSSTHATVGEGTITRAIARTETLVRLFQVDHTLEILRALPPSDTRRDPLLKFWGAHRDQLARAVGGVS